MRESIRAGGGGRVYRVVAFMALTTLILGLGRPGLADDTILGRAVDGVYPISSADVEMVAEDVTITLPGEATCVFTFRNTSTEPVEVLMGFPGEYASEVVSEVPEYSWPEHSRGGLWAFRAFVDGAEVAVATEAGSMGPEGPREYYATWYTFAVSFAPGQERTVTNTYHFQSSIESTGNINLGYVLTTGSYWRGPIGKAKVTVKLGEIRPWQVVRLHPNSWRLSPDGETMTWERSAFEPRFDLQVSHNEVHWPADYPSYVDPAWSQKYLDIRAGWEELLRQAPGLGQDEILAFYSQAMTESAEGHGWGDGGPQVRATYLRSFLKDFQWTPPSVADVQVSFSEPESANPVTVKLTYTDPDADVTRLTVRVSHRDEDGGEVLDREATEAGFTPDQLGTSIYELAFVVTPGRLYTFTAEVEDSQGLVGTGSVMVSAQPPAAAEPGLSLGAVPVLWVGLAGIGLLALVVSIVRSASHKGRSSKGPSSPPPAL